MSRVDHSSSDSSEEGEDNGNKIDIHLGSSLISINFWTLSNYSLYVCENCSRKEFIEHFSIDLQAFQNQNNVKEENIKAFFNCINEKHIDITNEAFLDFYKLADYLKIKKFQKDLKKFLNSHSIDINFIVLTKLEIMNDNSNDENKPVNLLKLFEECLPQRINECLQNDNFKQIPISQIYHLLEKSSDISSDLLYSFINQSIERFYILFAFLDVEKLSDANFQDLNEKYNNSMNGKEKRYYESIACNIPYINKLRQTIKKQDFDDQICQDLNLIFENKKEHNDKNSFSNLKISSEKGNSNASYMLGLLYENGQGVEKDFDQAKFYYNKSFEQGNSNGLLRIGTCYYFGYCTEKDPFRAFEYFKQAAELGNGNAFYRLGVCYLDGIGAQLDSSKAFECFQKAEKLGNTSSLCVLGTCYAHGLGVEIDYSKAIEYYQRSVDIGDSNAFCCLGACYGQGIGVEKDLSKAFEYYQKALDLGNKNAEIFMDLQSSKNDYTKFCQLLKENSNSQDPDVAYMLGVNYENGISGEIDLSKAIEYYSKAAELGLSDAINSLGVLYENGKGVDKDISKAIEYYQQAANLGNSDSIFNLAKCYFKGIGVDVDLPKSIEYMQQAANLGNGDSYYSLGFCYENGIGVPKDLSKAIENYHKGAELGNSDAI